MTQGQDSERRTGSLAPSDGNQIHERGGSIEVRTWTAALPYLGGCLGDEGSASIRKPLQHPRPAPACYRIQLELRVIAARGRRSTPAREREGGAGEGGGGGEIGGEKPYWTSVWEAGGCQQARLVESALRGRGRSGAMGLWPQITALHRASVARSVAPIGFCVNLR